MDQITEISKIGFDAGTGSKSTHMSMHLACDTHDTATKALGAVVVALADATIMMILPALGQHQCSSS